MRLRDTLSGQLKDLPKESRPIKIYTCGPTVYDYPHLGNWYAFLRWDLLVRALQAEGYETLWVMNITDVGHLVSDADEGEDKLVAKALCQKKTAYEVAEFYGNYFRSALKRLNFSFPDHLPKATEHIAEQIELIKSLEDKGLTYMIDDGLYFETAKCPQYGQLAKTENNLQELRPRIAGNSLKKSDSDFALWKLSPKGEKRDMEWDSPWGKGFPGWHIECSAMAYKYLGQTLDIHAGGIDHIPVHHTNEIAQSEMGYGRPMAHIWLHSNFALVDSQKMSKSLNNFYTLEDIEAKGYSLSALRLAIFSCRYHNLANFSWDLLAQAEKRLKTYELLSVRRYQLQKEVDSQGQRQLLDNTLAEIKSALSNDLQSPKALEIFDRICQQISLVPLSSDLKDSLSSFITAIDNIFGLQLSDLPDLEIEQKTLITQRQTARANQDWAEADRLRDQLAEVEIEIFDTDFGQIWHKSS